MLSYIQIYRETLEALKPYPEADRYRIIEAMLIYGEEGTEPNWPEGDIKWFAWPSFRQRVDAAEKKSAKNRANGMNGGRPAQSGPAQDEATETEENQTEPNETQLNPTEPNESHKSESQSESDPEAEAEAEKSTKARAREALEQRFETFWAAYPRHQDKLRARNAFFRLKPSDEQLQTMLAALTAQRASPQWSEPRFVPHPSTWLNGRRWEDTPTTGSPRRAGTMQTAYQQRDYQPPDPMKRPEWLNEMLSQEEPLTAYG